VIARVQASVIRQAAASGRTDAGGESERERLASIDDLRHRRDRSLRVFTEQPLRVRSRDSNAEPAIRTVAKA